MNELILYDHDFGEFRSWLNLNLDGLTWQGRFKKEFESFWDSFFEDGLTLKKVIERFDYAYSQVRIGSLSSWFLWLRDKFLSYIFIFKNQSIGKIAFESGISASVLATILRSKKAIAIDRAFISMRHFANSNKDLFEQINNLRKEMQTRLGEHDTQPGAIYDALENLLDKKEAEAVIKQKWKERERIGFKKE